MHPWHKDPLPTGQEERQCILDWLDNEITECKAVKDIFPLSPDMWDMALMRALYLQQTVSFISRGEHIRSMEKSNEQH